MSQLFSPFKLRDVTIKNRVFVSPMCQYSSEDGFPTEWHYIHIGSRAVGGAGLVMVEATAVTAEGRITAGDSGIWSDAHGEAFRRIASFIKSQGAVSSIQIAHAGRKASCDLPWRGGKGLSLAQGGWTPIAPSALAFDEQSPVPRAMTITDIDQVVEDFGAATERSLNAGFEVIEIHAAHGYLLHEFLSPLSNKRTDDYGGSLENRMRIVLRVAEKVRGIVPQNLPVFTRISATDWIEGAWDLAQSIELCKRLKKIGIDLVDCSSGAIVPKAPIPLGPGYQVPLADGIRREAGIATGAVGMITEPQQAEEIIASGKADVVLLARALLRDPYWPLHAAEVLGAELEWPIQYGSVKKKK